MNTTCVHPRYKGTILTLNFQWVSALIKVSNILKWPSYLWWLSNIYDLAVCLIKHFSSRLLPFLILFKIPTFVMMDCVWQKLLSVSAFSGGRNVNKKWNYSHFIHINVNVGDNCKLFWNWIDQYNISLPIIAVVFITFIIPFKWLADSDIKHNFILIFQVSPVNSKHLSTNNSVTTVTWIRVCQPALQYWIFLRVKWNIRHPLC